MEHSGKHITTQMVGAENVFGAGRQQAGVLHLGGCIGIWGNHVCENGQEADHQKNSQADHSGAVLTEPTHDLQSLAVSGLSLFGFMK